ncbi:hypothetical protein [Dickeya oryzae]|uniref:hypothetical protein n=1 Tax=Dickeya oryzae TaxID=1240404 RepID=UPI00187C1375|nr:hypothetical protein [Dickeya oryzae]
MSHRVAGTFIVLLRDVKDRWSGVTSVLIAVSIRFRSPRVAENQPAVGGGLWKGIVR